MNFYTERHGMRTPIERTETISIEMYAVLYDCCEKYFDNIAWKYPEQCPDGNGCCGLDYEKFNTAMTFDIPNLYRNYRGVIDKPRKMYLGDEGDYDQYALLDLIELIANESRDISNKFWHSYHRHFDLTFTTTKMVEKSFRIEINNIFEKIGLLYILSEFGIVERIVENSPLTRIVETNVSQISEKGTRELLEEAILLYKIPNPANRNDAVEKIWDALERLKTYYTSFDKKISIEKIVIDMSNGQAEFIDLFNEEFTVLTKIGNNFRIRHHETNKIDITDTKHYDYFFNRCLSLIALAIQYLH